MKAPWALVFIVKLLFSVAIADVSVLPVFWFLRVPLPHWYISFTCFEGGFIVLVGVFLLVNSLFSKIAVTDDRYVGFGTIRRGVQFEELKSEHKSIMRKRGILMIAVGLLLLIPTLMLILKT